MSGAPSALPPPAVFTHEESVHAICLPPLATFLATLSSSEHIRRLNDILEQFRTPSSYHRVDVREVQSSELPPGSPARGVEARVEEEWQKREKGEPVVLPPEMTREAYAAIGAALEADIGEEHLPGIGQAGERRSDDLPAQGEAGPSTWDGTQQNATPLGLNAHQPDHSAHPRPVNMADKQDETIAAAPIHQLPPSGPKRRVRELRLDLRTLDAAALFALETWRRQELGLDKLVMEVPDSIWYKDPTPPASAEPPRRKPGRPRKRRTSEIEASPTSGPSHAQEGETDMEAHTAALEAEARASSGDVNDIDALPGGTVMEALHRLAQEQGFAQPQADTRDDGHDGHDGRATSVDRSPSPDVILDDAFNEKDDEDPDFFPTAKVPGRPVSDLVDDSESEDEAQPRRRGRPPKEVVAGDGAEPRKRGRPPKSAIKPMVYETHHEAQAARRAKHGLGPTSNVHTPRASITPNSTIDATMDGSLSASRDARRTNTKMHKSRHSMDGRKRLGAEPPTNSTQERPSKRMRVDVELPMMPVKSRSRLSGHGGGASGRKTVTFVDETRGMNDMEPEGESELESDTGEIEGLTQDGDERRGADGSEDEWDFLRGL